MTIPDLCQRSGCTLPAKEQCLACGLWFCWDDLEHHVCTLAAVHDLRPEEKLRMAVSWLREELKGLRYRCSVCGSDEVEAEAWVQLNSGTFVEWFETAYYWCPTCAKHRENPCQVNAEEFCVMHEQAFSACRAESTALEKGRAS